MKAAAQVIADAAARHARQRFLDDLALPGEAASAVVPAREQELDRRGVRELGRRAEAAVAHVEQLRHLVGGAADEIGAHRPRLRFIERLDDVLANRARISGHAIRFLAVGAGDFHQDAAKSRPAVRVVVRREVGAAEKHFALGRQECRERPAALPAERLHGALVARVHVGPLVAVHLHAHEIAIQDLGDRGIFVRLAVHDVAPVAPHRADVEQDRFLGCARPAERGVAPRQPVHRLVRGGLEIRRRLVAEQIQECASRYRMAVRVNNSAPTTSDSSSMSNVGL